MASGLLVRLVGHPDAPGRTATGVGWRQFVDGAMLAGIGFTVPLFITSLAFDDETLAAPAKFGILLASVVAALAGSLLFIGRAGAEEPANAT